MEMKEVVEEQISKTEVDMPFLYTNSLLYLDLVGTIYMRATILSTDRFKLSV